jgi:two-component system NtrC family sensor kinase
MKITIERALEKVRLQKTLRHYMSELEQKVEERTRELREANQKLEKSLAELKAAQDHLIQTEKLSALGELIAGVAHELSNPLTTIVGFAELLTKTVALGNGTKGQLEKISGEAFRCHQIVRSLLSFARKQKPEKAYIDINVLCDGVLNLLAYQFKVSNIALERRFAEGLPRTMADPHQLQQVFINITTNAYQAMSSAHGRGTLVVETKRRDGMVEIAFQDNGPGIIPEHQRKIFDPFFTTKEHGTGLGLSLSYGIIQEHEGRISVESIPGAGTTFLVELPIVAQPSSVEEPAARAVEVAGKRRVLVIDDEENNLRLLMAIIQHLGHQVEGVSSGQEALEKIVKEDYDVLISDVRMPHVDGQRLYQQVKAMRPELIRRIIFTSGDIVSDDTRSFLERVQCPFVMKPFRIADIEAIIRQTAGPVTSPRLADQPGGGDARV